MAAKIDIDALKIFEKLRTNEAGNRQKNKNSQLKISTLDLPVLKKKNVLRRVHF